MTVNRIESFSELSNALDNLTNLSEEMIKTLSKSQSIYEGQSAGWDSHNSTKESDTMINYSEESKTIAKNVRQVSDAVKNFKTGSYNIDERQ